MSNGVQRLDRLYEGKAKVIYKTTDPGLVIIEYKDDATAFNGQKRGRIPNKGVYNNQLTALLYRYLAAQGVQTHYVSELGDRSQLAHRVSIIPLEIVVRNRAAGSLAQRLGMAEGTPLAHTVVEFYYKQDDLSDPWVNRTHVAALQLAREHFVDEAERVALRVNAHLQAVFLRAGLELLDVKMEFGMKADGLYLADEISPDTCRLWEVGTGRRLDKDRFRRDLGDVEAAYREVLDRMRSVLRGHGLGGEV